MTFLLKKPKEPSFAKKGFRGFKFPLKNKKIQIAFVESEKGHDTFIISKDITHIYYILDGKGFFNIEGKRYDVEPGMLIEVPPKIEFSYSGKMKILLIMNPPFYEGHEKITRMNPAV
jgi:mannose-6-phosphate isomerase-like protein (cupin superfamily)